MCYEKTIFSWSSTSLWHFYLGLLSSELYKDHLLAYLLLLRISFSKESWVLLVLQSKKMSLFMFGSIYNTETNVFYKVTSRKKQGIVRDVPKTFHWERGTFWSFDQLLFQKRKRSQETLWPTLLWHAQHFDLLSHNLTNIGGYNTPTLPRTHIAGYCHAIFEGWNLSGWGYSLRYTSALVNLVSSW